VGRELAAVDWSRYLRIGAAARRAECSPEWLRYLVLQGRLSPHQTPFGLVFEVAEIDALRAERGRRSRVRQALPA
jgi:hypothetical protein